MRTASSSQKLQDERVSLDHFAKEKLKELLYSFRWKVESSFIIHKTFLKLPHRTSPDHQHEGEEMLFLVEPFPKCVFDQDTYIPHHHSL